MCRLRKSTFTNLCAYVKVQAFMAHIQPSNNKPVLSRSVLTHGTTMKGYLLTNAPCFYVSCTSWGRWGDILAHGRFKRPLKEADVETICRALLAYCLLHYRGDENIKSFIWDLITPSADGTTKTLTNHSGNLYCVVMDVHCGYTVHKEYWIYKKKKKQVFSFFGTVGPRCTGCYDANSRPFSGLSTPVPRGRKGKKGKTPAQPLQSPRADWLVTCNPDHLLQEDSYKRHLKHHCNK